MKERRHIPLEEFVADPFGSLRRAREHDWLADFEPTVGVVRHADVRELLSDGRLRANFPDFLRSFGVTSGPFYDWMASSPLNRDGADHQRWRSVMSRTFTPRRVESIRPFLKEAAKQLIDEFAARGRCEFVGEFADVYPSLGMCELIGVPSEDRDRFRGWANTIGVGFNFAEVAARIAEIDAALVQLLDYTGSLASSRRADPRDDLITRIAQAGDDDGWTDFEVRGAIAGLVFAGHETTKNQLGWLIAVLADEPQVWDDVARGRLPSERVVEEILRFRSTVTAVGRTVAEPVERHGDRLEPGTPLLLSLWSADSDDAAFPAADRFDPRRASSEPHLAFGHGPHHCLGAALARAELQEALNALTARFTCPRLEAGAEWSSPAGINGPARLPIVFEERTPA